MKVLSVPDCQAWVAKAGHHLGPDLSMKIGGAMLPAPYLVVANTDVSLPYLSRVLLDWLSVGHERLLLVTAGSGGSVDETQLFETIRKGCGNPELLVEAPGHVFQSTKDRTCWYDDRPAIDVSEESIAMWMVGLMLDWTWGGVVLAADTADFILLGDGYLRVYTSDATRLVQAQAVVGELGLTLTDRFPWQ